MNQTLVLTILLAVVVMGIVIAGLAIGFLLTGKSRLRRGCGLTPGKKPNEKETTTCPICGDKKVCEEKKEDNEHDNNNDKPH